LRRPVESARYVAIKYAERLEEAGEGPSVGRVGGSHDNALAETIKGLYKAEVIWRRRPWRNVEQVEFATLEWVDWFNNRRLLEPIGNIPPAEAEARHYAQIEETAKAVRLKQNSLRQTVGSSMISSPLSLQKTRVNADEAKDSESQFRMTVDKVTTLTYKK